MRRLFLIAVLLAACGRGPKPLPLPQENPVSKPDINAVLSRHDRELMAIPGVVGVYVGLLDDGRTTCLKVMVVKETPELRAKIPKQLEGYTVLVEETGEIRPMRNR